MGSEIWIKKLERKVLGCAKSAISGCSIPPFLSEKGGWCENGENRQIVVPFPEGRWQPLTCDWFCIHGPWQCPQSTIDSQETTLDELWYGFNQQRTAVYCNADDWKIMIIVIIGVGVRSSHGGDNIGTARFPSGLTTDFGSNFSRSEYAHVWLASARWSNMVNGSPPAASCKDHCLAPFLHLQNREAGSHTGCCTTGGLPLKEGPIYLGLILDITLLISSY